MKRFLRFGVLPATLCSALAQTPAAPPASPAPVTSPAAGDSAAMAPAATAAAETPAAAPAPSPAPADSEVSKRLADTEDKLSTALKSYSLVQDENARLTAAVDKANADKAVLEQQLQAARGAIQGLQAQAAATAQIGPLQTALRQAQAEASQLAADNADLRTRLAVLSPFSGSARPSPMRPMQDMSGMAAPAPALSPPAAAVSTADTATPSGANPPPAPAPAKTYVVAEGDSLIKISKQFYGTTARWKEILDANRGTVKDEKSLSIGSTLTIP